MVPKIGKMASTGSNKYKPPVWHRNPHTATILPAVARSIELPKPYVRERIVTADHDFLDLDWLRSKKNEALVIISHGLEGNSHRPYVKGMARAFHNHGFDVLAWNYRGCSEEMNNQLRMYHSGATEDLEQVVEHALTKDYQKLFLVGFSLGGNLTLKYLGEQGADSPVRKAVVFSVPLDLEKGARNISRTKNRIYERRFLKSLSKKVYAKHRQFPEKVDLAKLKQVRTIFDFDDLFTAPIHGFLDARHYYHVCSSKFFVDRIRTETLVINALNDPFLPSECLDHKIFHRTSNVRFETPRFGGHCGFAQKSNSKTFWSEERAIAFCLD